MFEIEVGETKTIVAKAFVLDSKGNKVYSSYSDEVILDGTIASRKPEIEVTELVYDNNVKAYEYGVTLTNQHDFGSIGGTGSYMPIVTHMEIYKKVEGDFIPLTSDRYESFADVISCYIEPGENVEIAIRMYVLNNDGERVYSEYSDAFMIVNNLEDAS